MEDFASAFEVVAVDVENMSTPPLARTISVVVRFA
jgi:hypothetical protein